MYRHYIHLVLAGVTVISAVQANAQETDSKPANQLIHELAAPAFRHTCRVTSIAWFERGNQLITASDEGAVAFDTETGKRLRTLQTAGSGRVVAAGNRLIVATLSGDLAAYDVGRGKPAWTAKRTGGGPGHIGDFARQGDVSRGIANPI